MLPTITELEQIQQLRTYTTVDESGDRNRVECRICLEDNTTSDGLFIAPCKCKGSVKHVHFQCFSDWILKSNKHMLESNQSAIGKICCEMCKRDIYYSMQRRPICRQFQQIKESICNDLRRFILSMFILSFLLASMIVGCVYAGILLKGGINGQQLFQGVVILVAILFVCSFAVLTLYFVTQLYLMKTKTVITKIGRLKEEGGSLKKRQSVESLDNMQEQNTIFYLE